MDPGKSRSAAPEFSERHDSDSEIDVFVQAEHRFRSSFDADPVEDGITHPAELILHDMISHAVDGANERFDLSTSENIDAAFRASLLRVISRRRHFSESWRTSIIEANLSSENVEVRDAAVQAAESWEDPSAIELLRKHRETTPWLADYIARVIRDLPDRTALAKVMS